MSHPVFISYSRDASVTHAQALAARLGDLAFLDTGAIDDGDEFPQRLLDGILDARVVVIFATKAYSESRFCRLEARLALAGGDAAGSHLVLALGEGSQTVLDAMPAAVASQSWPSDEEAERLDTLVQRRLSQRLPAIRQRLAADEAQRLSAAFLEESKLPPPQSLHGIICSFSPGVAGQSIGARFVGRADLLRDIHRVLSEAIGAAAQLTGRITAGGGFGKTRLAVEYVHRYGARYYPGGVFWVNAASGAIEGEFWRVLSALNPRVPDLAVMRVQGRDVRRELERALRKVGQRALYVVDDIPEAAVGRDPPVIADFCPAVGAVTVLATSRQDTREESVSKIAVDILGRDSAILLLTDNVPGAAALSWTAWARIAEWVGDLPIALDLLNRSLALGSITPLALLKRAHSIARSSSATGELDRLSEALRGQVPKGAVRGVTEAFSISFEKLDGTAQQVAQLLAQLGPAPIPEAFIEALREEGKSPGVRAALRSRHFVTGGGDLSFGVMHRLMADFLRSMAGESGPELLEGACNVLWQVMTPDRCLDPRHWPLMRLCRPHAEALFERGSALDVSAVASTEVGLMAAILAWAQGDFAGARRLGEWVLEVRTRVLGGEHPDTLRSMHNLAETRRAQGDHPGARQLEERVVEVNTRMLGGEHPNCLASMTSLAAILFSQGDRAGAQRLQGRVLEVRTRSLGEEHADTLTAMNNLALTLSTQGDHAGARRLQERVLEVITRVLGEEYPHTLTAMSNLALTLGAQGDHAGARRFQERVLDVSTRLLGEEHPDTLRSMGNLAETLVAQGDHVGARRLQERVLEVRTHRLEEEHPDTLTSMNNLAVTLGEQGEHAGAQRLGERALELMVRVLGEEHPHTLTAMNNLALTLSAQGNDAGARGLQERALELMVRVLGEEHPDTLTLRGNLADTLTAQGDQAGAQRLHERSLEMRTRVLGGEHPDTLMSMGNLAATLRARGDHAGARLLKERVLEARTRVLGEEHPNTLRSMNNLAATLWEQGDVEVALRLLRKCLAGQRKVLGEDHPDTAATADALIHLEAHQQTAPPSAQPGP
jgi:tetratricopeptide (TPR) repeat protein